MEKIQFAVYSPGKKDYILIPYKYLFPGIFMNSTMYILSKIFPIDYTICFSKATEGIIADSRDDQP